MEDIENQMLWLIETYKSAVKGNNPGAMKDIYDPEVTCESEFAPGFSWKCFDQLTQGQWASNGGSVDVEFIDVSISGDVDSAWMFCRRGYKWYRATGKLHRTMVEKLQWTLKRTAEGLRVTSEYTEGPIGNEYD